MNQGPKLQWLMQACLLVQERLTHLIIRMSCQSVEHAAVLLNPVISTLQQQTAAATVSLLSEIDALQVLLLLIAGLSLLIYLCSFPQTLA